MSCKRFPKNKPISWRGSVLSFFSKPKGIPQQPPQKASASKQCRRTWVRGRRNQEQAAKTQIVSSTIQRLRLMLPALMHHAETPTKERHTMSRAFLGNRAGRGPVQIQSRRCVEEETRRLERDRKQEKANDGQHGMYPFYW